MAPASRRWLAVAGVSILAAAGTALWPRETATPGAADEAARWKARALEAEARIAVLRQRLLRLEGEGRPTPVQRDIPSPELVLRDEPDHRAEQREPQPPDEVWEALVGGALQEQARARLGRDLEPDRLDRLLRRLHELREAAVALDTPAGEPDDAALGARLQRSVLLVEADVALREELGIGMSELLGELDAGAVEEVTPGDVAPELPEETAPGDVAQGPFDGVAPANEAAEPSTGP